jgi:hypothetical protein
MSYPFQVCSGQARVRASLRASGSGDASHDIGVKFSPIMRCSSSSVFTHLRPDVFSRIEFWCGSWEPVNYHTLLRCQEFLYDLALMDGMIIPDEKDVTGSAAQQLFEKNNDFLAGQTMPVRANAQFELLSVWQNQQSADDIETVMMADTGADGGRFTTRRPSALER